jgi:hypothetical protein
MQEILMRVVIALFISSLMYCSAAIAAEHFDIKGFHVGMTYDQFQSVVGEYSWTGFVDNRTNKKLPKGSRPFTLAGVPLAESPTWMNNSDTFNQTLVGGAERIVFTIPVADVDSVIQSLKGKYPDFSCRQVNIVDGARSHVETECSLEANREQLEFSPGLNPEHWLLFITSFDYLYKSSHNPRYKNVDL